ncbi:MAG: hypothetical protein N3A72_09460 [bacterium]|nr:hypothetical protein [bacterium]
MFTTFWDWVLGIGILIVLILFFGEIYIFYRDRRSSAIFAALSYLSVAIGLSFYFTSSLWLRLVFGPLIFIFAFILFWVSYSARKEERAPRAIFISKTQKEKEAEKQSKLEKKRVAEISASGAIAAEKRTTARIPIAGGKSLPKSGSSAGKTSPPTTGRTSK